MSQYNDHNSHSAEIENDLDYPSADFDEVYEPEPVFCPMCNGGSGIMGVLGALTWYQCRYCGIEFNRKEE